MFRDAKSFNQKLCGAAWVHSKASKTSMFVGSSGSLLRTACASTPAPFSPQSKTTSPFSPQTKTTPGAFSPRSKAELKSAVNACLEQLQQGDCSNAPHGPIVEWDVSRVTDMSAMFLGAESFNVDISKWDVSRVTDMNTMFRGAQAFDGDISKWDVSRVANMDKMFCEGMSFNRSYAGLLGSIRRHQKTECLKIRLDQYQRQCARPPPQPSRLNPKRSSKAPLVNTSNCPRQEIVLTVRMDQFTTGTYPKSPI